eukprot:1146712-Pelagomonas_calceolata.AAC.2
MARLVEGMGSIDSPPTPRRIVESDLSSLKLLAQFCQAGFVLLLTTSLRLMLRSTRCEEGVGGLFGAAGGASSLIRNAGVKEVGRYNTVRDLLSDVQVMLSQGFESCAAPTWLNLSPLPMSMFTKPAPQGLLLRALMIILPATLWRSIFMLEMI